MADIIKPVKDKRTISPEGRSQETKRKERPRETWDETSWIDEHDEDS